METTLTAPALDLNLASEAAPPDLPVVADAPKLPDAAPPRSWAPTPLTSAGLAEMLANRRSRNDGWTPIRVAAFIERLAETGSVTKAAGYADMSVAAAYHLRNHPDALAFREAWDSALAVRFETLTEMAMDRVINGVEKIKWVGDEIVGHDRVFSDRLLIYMINRCDPDRDRSAPLPGDPPLCRSGGPRAGALPLAADFVVAAGTETGKLGWDPDHDDHELDPDIAADVAAMHNAQADRKAAKDAAIAEESAAAVARAAILNEERAQTRQFMREDEAWEAEIAELKRASKSSTFELEPRPRRGRRR